jgi:hypothetical protein
MIQKGVNSIETERREAAHSLLHAFQRRLGITWIRFALLLHVAEPKRRRTLKPQAAAHQRI